MKTSETPAAGSPVALLESARHELIEHTRAGRGGRAAVATFASRLDALLQQLFTSLTPPARPAALFALGGYGRRQLCLHSDVDLLVLFDGSIGDEEERFVRELLNPLWDLKLILGHQVRELVDFERIERDNPEFLLALVDARLIVGSASLFDRFSAVFHRPDTHAFIVNALG